MPNATGGSHADQGVRPTGEPGIFAAREDLDSL
jgi:hypothetical protein